MNNFRYYGPGSLMILFALLIVAVPEILVAIVAASMILIGIGALYVGHMMKTSEKQVHRLYRWVEEDRFPRFGWRYRTY